jgi:hypothetical protein
VAEKARIAGIAKAKELAHLAKIAAEKAKIAGIAKAKELADKAK